MLLCFQIKLKRTELVAAQMLMKEGLNAKAISRIGGAFKRLSPLFPIQKFENDCLNGLENLELKQRTHHIIAILHQCLPNDFEQTADLLLGIKAFWDYGDANDPLRGFAAWAVTDYVAEHGLQHPHKSLQVLEYLTDLFSSEFAIRYFIVNHYDISYEKLLVWADHESEHIRRLASEGCRPRLPWGMRLQQFCKDPQPLVPILEKLNDDSSEYVRRSVANNLNDIAKDNPEFVINLCQQWSRGASLNTQWIIKHATRTLVKNGHPDVFALLGYTHQPKLRLNSLSVNKPMVKLGGSIGFEMVIISEATFEQKLVIDYAVHHVKANGNTTPKVFKLKTLNIAGGETVTLSKNQPFKPISTRRYYGGVHSIEVLVNGVGLGCIDFELQL
jgi:3-methyladenine DNA glycosylase AlkC